MKRLIFILLVGICLFNVSKAQTNTYYCEIKGAEKEISSGLNIVFDLGTGPVYGVWSNLKDNQKMVDQNGKEIKFNSMVDAGNYMSSKGWKFLQAYSSTYSSDCIIHWIFTKEAATIEEAMQGIETKETFKKKHKK